MPQTPPMGLMTNFQTNTMTPPPIMLCQRTPAVGPPPEQSAQHHRTEGAAEAYPREGDNLEHGGVGIPGHDDANDGDDDQGDAGDEHTAFFAHLQAEHALDDVLGHEEEAASIWLSQVDMVQARIPAMTTLSQQGGQDAEGGELGGHGDQNALRVGHTLQIACVHHRETQHADQDGNKHGDDHQMEPTRRLTFSFFGS